MATKISFARIYEPLPARGSYKVLVDRFWPRGIKKESIDYWAKDLAPSTELRTYYNHDPDKFNEFSKLYKKELASKTEELQKILKLANSKPLVLLTATKDINISGAKVLYGWITRKLR